MYGTPPEPPAGTVLTEGGAGGPAPILVQLAGPDRQNRLTVVFRSILAIPQAFVLYFIFLAAGVALIIGWFGALFMGRLPGFAASFLSGTLRWQTRFYAYIYLLTGQYPPFSLDDDPAYPVRVAAKPGKLNRLAVLFRLVLVFPVAVLHALVVWGMSTIVLLVTWLIVLIRGAMPQSLHQAIAAVVRYTTRVSGFYWMLTSEYPWGLFGDPAEPAEPAASAEPGEHAPEGGPPMPPVGPDQVHGGEPFLGEYPVREAPEPGPVYGAVPPGGVTYETVPPPAPADSGWRLVLSAGAKRLVWLFIALGVATVAAVGVSAGISASSTVNTQVAIRDVQAAHDTLIRSTQSYATARASCQRNADPLACVTGADRDLARAFGAFGQSVRGTAMPSSATAAANTLTSDSAGAQQALQQLAASTSYSQYQQTLQSSGLQQILSRFDRDYQALGTALNAS